eukprot:CAMPEP_0204181456 /NCGR_PEP_ID=MMETSP0361-20130328/51931_1 /ASSEMBLY_ACC=CAM_ASM_000343 /TAXON_ID=268821 /ORGANISM="Scrippsiella Hangoei, Strain SHTV-5" /LENGTH=59 /DNA_ID=CAMNT_0051141035 /DNA_START=28 /DNA_END=204 /DNA_ORIENTATION=-
MDVGRLQLTILKTLLVTLKRGLPTENYGPQDLSLQLAGAREQQAKQAIVEHFSPHAQAA